MASREEILSAIRKALSNGAEDVELPEPPEVWPVQGTSPDELLTMFSTHLEAVSGRSIVCKDRADAAARMVDEIRATIKPDGDDSVRLGVMARDSSLQIAKLLEVSGGMPIELTTPPEKAEDADPKILQKIDLSIVCAEFLLTDTGSAVIRAPAAFDRLLCYLPPVCFVLAKKTGLREHLPHAWQELKGDAGIESARTGEYLIVTGPSRTADIEKILILGVHGPKELVVFVLENE